MPGIAVVHCLLVTADRKVVLAQRPPNTPHAPGRWSASYEEQITGSDFSHTSIDAASAAAVRGLREEFAVEASAADTTIVSVLMEMPILNPAIVVIVRCQATYQQIEDTWGRHQREGHHDEIAGLRAVELSEDRLRSTALAWEQERLHPTSALRLLLLARWLKSAER